MSGVRVEPPAGGVTVFHIERSIATFAPVGPDDLARHELARRFELDDAQAEKLRALVAATPLAPHAGAIDARWELRFGAESTDARSACWLDRTGTVFATRDTVYAVDDPARALIAWLRETFGEDDRIEAGPADVPGTGPMPAPLPSP